MYYPRHLEHKVSILSKVFKIILINGARQVGKSTLLRHIFPEFTHITFDPLTDLWQARADPELFLMNHKPPLILDEIQYTPQVLPGIKRLVDENPNMGQYFLTGSQNFSIMRHVSESLAGRVGILELLGMTPFEKYQAPQHHWLKPLLEHPQTLATHFRGVLKTDISLYQLIMRGALPQALQMPFEALGDFYNSYLKTYLERDVRLLEGVQDLATFNSFITLLSALTAQEIQFTQLGREIGISRLTAQRWLNVLTYSYQWHAIPAFYKNTIKRISKKAKGHFADTGLACYLLGISSEETLARHPMLGALFESYCVNMILALNQTLATPAKLHHFRSHSGVEVDLILERDGQCYPIEIKAKSQINKHDARGIRAFIETYPKENVPLGIILHPGNTCYYVTENILALPYLALIHP
jgi:uncharacterized protein